MSESLREKVEKEMDVAGWEELKPHYERGALVFVHPDVDLAEVAVKVAEDDVEQVQKWLDTEMIYKAESQHASKFESQPDRQLVYVIVQPYVLVQERSN